MGDRVYHDLQRAICPTKGAQALASRLVGILYIWLLRRQLNREEMTWPTTSEAAP